MARSRRAQSAQRKRRRKGEDEQQQHEAVRRKSQRLAERGEEEEEERADEDVAPGSDNPVEESNEPELRPHAHEQRLGTDITMSFEHLRKVLTFKNVLVVPEAVKNALDACPRAASLASNVPVLRAPVPPQDSTMQAVNNEAQLDDLYSTLVPESHESELFALFGEADEVARLIGWQSCSVHQARETVSTAEGSIKAEVGGFSTSDAPEMCMARGIAVHPANNSNVAGGRHPTLKHLRSLVRYLSRKGFNVKSIISSCKQNYRQR